MTRPDPDQILTHVQRDEEAQKQGQLKIFLGYAAGVGKTYAMLAAAQTLKEQGTDVVIGYVETHGRAETDMLADGLEIIPRRQVSYRGVTLTELDTNAVLHRNPAVVLVDELAHTNAPGSRHTKRHQDVEEFLKAGIDVYTTLNIQHLESLNSVVKQITQVEVQETIPDSVLDKANDIELIDLPINELRQRLKEGKVYVPQQADRAMNKFFRPGNLSALRELALRRTADQVDERLRAYMQTHAIAGPWPTNERLLVCVSPSPLSTKLVRSASRLAARLHADWTAIYVELTNREKVSDAAQERVNNTLQLAEELGGRTATIAGQSIAAAVVEYARAENITRLVMGMPLAERRSWWPQPSLVDQVVRQGNGLDIYVISGTDKPDESISRSRLFIPPTTLFDWQPYVWSALLVAIATGLGFPLRPFIEPTNLVMLYLVTVMIAAVGFGRYPAITASVLSVLAFNVIFVPPYYTLVVTDAQYLLTFAALLGVGILISTLTARAREQEQAARRRERQTAALYELSRKLSVAAEAETVIQVIVEQVTQTFGGQIALFLPDSERLELRLSTTKQELQADERAVAVWAFEYGQAAGRYTKTLSGAAGYYLPLRAGEKTIGILGVYSEETTPTLTLEQQHLLDSFVRQAALALERAQLAEQAREAELIAEAEKLQSALLNSISHDFRTPLASITGSLSSLLDDGHLLSEEDWRDLVSNAAQEAQRLNQLVANMLDMTRLESGRMKLNLQPVDVQDLIGVVLTQLSKRIGEREIEVNIPYDLPPVSIDFSLMAQVLVNLVDNALKYSPVERPIDIAASLRGNEVFITVADYGPGIPPEEIEKVFEKFYRLSQWNDVSGTGLGLSISKGIVEAHGGRIWAHNRLEGQGAIMTVALKSASMTSLT